MTPSPYAGARRSPPSTRAAARERRATALRIAAVGLAVVAAVAWAPVADQSFAPALAAPSAAAETAPPAPVEDPIAAVRALRFPDAALVSENERDFDDKELFSGPFARLYEPGEVVAAQGRVAEMVFEIPPAATSFRVYRAYAAGLERLGLSPVYECVREGCGGSVGAVINRRGVVTPANQADQRYGLFADARDAVFVSLFVTKRDSANPDLRRVSAVLEMVVTDPKEAEVASLSVDEIDLALRETGAAPIYGLEFGEGSAELPDSAAPILAQMAAYMARNPEAQILLVGHTDAKGGLEANLTLSKARAEAVRTALVDGFGVASERLAAHGVGFLAPRAPSGDASQRARNRRVEMVRR